VSDPAPAHSAHEFSSLVAALGNSFLRVPVHHTDI
jgi:hypothetical protein